VNGKITKACLLADPEKNLAVAQDSARVTIALPAQAPDPMASVVCLTM